MLREVAHNQQLDDRSEHGDYDDIITMDSINKGAKHIYNTIATVNNNSVTNVQNTTNNNIMSNSNNIMSKTQQSTTIITTNSQYTSTSGDNNSCTNNSIPPVEARSVVTTSIPRKALPPPQQTSLIGQQDEMKQCSEYDKICQRMSNRISEDNWLTEYNKQTVKVIAEKSSKWRKSNKRLHDNTEGERTLSVDWGK